MLLLLIFASAIAATPKNTDQDTIFNTANAKLFLTVSVSLYLLYFPTRLLFKPLLKPAQRLPIWRPVLTSFEFIKEKFYQLSTSTPMTFRGLSKELLAKGGNVGGLINDGNTCFMNCVLQSLASSKDFMRLLSDHVNANKEYKKGFVYSLYTLLSKLNASHGNKSSDYSVTGLVKKMSNGFEKHSFLGYNQEDAQEFFQVVLSNVEKELKAASNDTENVNKANNVLFGNVNELNKSFESVGDFYVPAEQIDPSLPQAKEKVYKFKFMTPADGLNVERIGCLTCGETGGLRYSVTTGLSLSLPLGRGEAINLSSLLSAYTEQETIEGVECNRCSLRFVVDKLHGDIESDKTPEKLKEMFKSRVEEIEQILKEPIISDEIANKYKSKNIREKVTKSKQCLISKPPKYLSLHFNRSVFDPQTGYLRKNDCRINFDSTLDLNPYVADFNDVNVDARYSMKKLQDLEIERKSLEIQLEGDEAGFSSSQSTNSENSESSEDSSVFDKNNLKQSIYSKVGELNDEMSKFNKPDLLYNLKAVIVHYGTHNYGHYIAYRKYRGVWWRISDETVEVVDESDVLSTRGVFMLFYEAPGANDESGETAAELPEDIKVEIAAQIDSKSMSAADDYQIQENETPSDDTKMETMAMATPML